MPSKYVTNLTVDDRTLVNMLESRIEILEGKYKTVMELLEKIVDLHKDMQDVLK